VERENMEKALTTTNAVSAYKIPIAHVLDIQNGMARVVVTESLRGKAYRKPVEVWMPIQPSKAERAVYQYVWEALESLSPSLIPFALESRSVMMLAKYLLRHRSGSHGTVFQYIDMIARYVNWLRQTPDSLISQCFDGEVPNLKVLTQHSKQLDEYIGELQAEGLAPGTIANRVKAVKTFYMVNGLKLVLPYRLSNRTVNHDRAPTPEELQRLIDLADLRGKVIVSTLALGGFRVGTLAKLKYYHVMEDLEHGIIPLHVHVEAEITKGKYGDYDTFLGAEAVEYLKAYLDVRRRGSPSGKIPPEDITEESPLIRDIRSRQPRPVDRRCLYKVVHNLYRRTGMLKHTRGRRHELCAHSIRKYFRTQLAALGVPSDYIEYMMGHKISAYHDVKMKGVEFLRNIYSASNLSIRPKMKVTKMGMITELIRSLGGKPEEELITRMFSQPHRTYCTPNEEDQ
jgi:site-specific recombinase XerD